MTQFQVFRMRQQVAEGARGEALQTLTSGRVHDISDPTIKTALEGLHSKGPVIDNEPLAASPPGAP